MTYWHAALLVLGLVMAAIGARALITIARKRRLTREARGWPQVDAQILESAVEDTGAPRSTADFLPLARVRRFLPRVKYRYRVGRAEHRGTAIGLFTRAPMLHDEAAALCGRYEPGEWVKLSVNPANAKQSALQPAEDGAMIGAVLGAALLVLGAAMIAFALIAS